jgi:PKD repeat protein
VTNPAGSSSVSHTVTVNPVVVANPVAGFYGNPVGSPPQVSGGGSTGQSIDGVASTTVNFLNTSTNGTAYSWDFGDGSGPDTTTTPSHAFSARGIYTVTLTITAPTGAVPYTRSNYVNIGCVVPTFANHSTSEAAGLYSGAGLTGTLWYQQQGAKNASKNPPGAAANIISQAGQPGGNWVAPTKQGNKPYECNYDVTVVYQ